jgi:hypothetical protein
VSQRVRQRLRELADHPVVREGLRRLEQAKADVRERLAGPPPVVIATDEHANGSVVVTTRFEDRRSPSGQRYQTIATWPGHGGLVEEHRWTDWPKAAAATHEGVSTRVKYAHPPER